MAWRNYMPSSTNGRGAMLERGLRDDDALSLARSELILGGQKSGKSRRAEALARRWLAAGAGQRAVLLATATASDAEMAARIERHRQDRARNCPGLPCIEVPLELPEAIARHSAPDTLVVVDCLTLWLSNCLWPQARHDEVAPSALVDAAPRVLALQQVVAAAPGPLVLVGNEIGMGVIPMGPAVRSFVDALGQLNQAIAQACERVNLMVAGLPLRVKGD